MEEMTKSQLIAKLESVRGFVSELVQLQTIAEDSQESFNEAEATLGEYQENFRSNRNTAIGLIVFVIAVFVADHFNITRITSFFNEWYGGLILGAAFIWSIVSAVRMVVYLIKGAFRKREVSRRRIKVEADNKSLADFFTSHAEQEKDADEMYPSGEYPYAKYIETGLNGVKSGDATTMEEAMQLIEAHQQRDIAKAEAEAEAARKRAIEEANKYRCRYCGREVSSSSEQTSGCSDCYHKLNHCPVCGKWDPGGRGNPCSYCRQKGYR